MLCSFTIFVLSLHEGLQHVFVSLARGSSLFDDSFEQSLESLSGLSSQHIVNITELPQSRGEESERHRRERTEEPRNR